MTRTTWLARRVLWSPVRTIAECGAGVAFYLYVALSLGLGGALLASTDRSANKVIQSFWFVLELVRYSTVCMVVWFFAAIYFTVFDREIFLSAWRETYRPWLHKGRADS